MKQALDFCLDTAAYVVKVGGKPLPYISAGLVVSWLATSQDLFEGDWGIGMTALLASSVSLMLLPPFLLVSEWAENRAKGNHSKLPVSMAFGVALFILWAVLVCRLA